MFVISICSNEKSTKKSEYPVVIPGEKDYISEINIFYFNRREKLIMMIGLGDFWVAAAYWANIGAVVLCVVYGICTWNRSDEEAPAADREEKE